MPVFNKTSRWPGSRIPYDPPTHKPVLDAIRLLNLAVGYPLLTYRTPRDHSFVKYVIKSDTGSSCSHIGCAHEPAQPIITSLKVHTIVHETCHCLGFEHEQFHNDYPWDDKGLVTANNAMLYMFQSTAIPINALIHKRIAAKFVSATHTASLSGKLGLEIPKGKVISNTTAADDFIKARFLKLKDPQIESCLHCDLDSVMMYGEYRDIAKEVASTGSKPIHNSGFARDPLSNEDVATIRHFYPRPAFVTWSVATMDVASLGSLVEITTTDNTAYRDFLLRNIPPWGVLGRLLVLVVVPRQIRPEHMIASQARIKLTVDTIRAVCAQTAFGLIVTGGLLREDGATGYETRIYPA